MSYFLFSTPSNPLSYQLYHNFVKIVPCSLRHWLIISISYLTNSSYIKKLANKGNILDTDNGKIVESGWTFKWENLLGFKSQSFYIKELANKWEILLRTYFTLIMVRLLNQGKHWNGKIRLVLSHKTFIVTFRFWHFITLQVFQDHCWLIIKCE